MLANHRIQIELPADTPQGEAEVIVLLTAPVTQDTPDSLQAFFEALDRKPLEKTYSREEIDAYLAEERASWE